MIVALAGRRVDKEGQVPARFPATAVDVVREKLREIFIANEASALVSSAAAGADLLALSEARKLGMHLVVILPFEREQFRLTSVADRPPSWSDLYDQVIEGSQPAVNVIVAPAVPRNRAYVETNHLIVRHALAIAKERHTSASALQVWEGSSRGANDVTEEFGQYAALNGLPVWTLSTR